MGVKPIITLEGSHTVNTVHFTDVKVPVENRIGEEGKGWTYAKVCWPGMGPRRRRPILVALEKLRPSGQGEAEEWLAAG